VAEDRNLGGAQQWKLRRFVNIPLHITDAIGQTGRNLTDGVLGDKI